MVKYSRFRCLR